MARRILSPPGAAVACGARPRRDRRPGRAPDAARRRAAASTAGASCSSASAGPATRWRRRRPRAPRGPDLDAAFAQARAVGMDADTIAGVVKAQVDNPRPSNQQPERLDAGLTSSAARTSTTWRPTSPASRACPGSSRRPSRRTRRPGVRPERLRQLPHPEGGGRHRDDRPRPRQGPAGHERGRDQAVDRRPERQDHSGLPVRGHAPELRADDQPAGPQHADQVPSAVRGQAGK